MNKNEVAFRYINELIELFRANIDAINIEGASKWSDMGWSVSPKTRIDFEINFFIKGDVNISLGNKNYVAHPGSIFFIDNSEGSFCLNGSYSVLFINFSMDIQEEKQLELYSQFKKCFKYIVEIPFSEKRGYVEEVFIHILKEMSLKQTGYLLKIKFMLLQFLIDLSREANSLLKGHSPYQYKKYSEMVSDIIVYLSENFQNDLSLTDIGNKFRLNPRYLNRVFKTITGYPIFQYQQQLKIEKAKRLLANSKSSILEIALELGFESSQYFSRVFKEYTKTSPFVYRKTMK